MDASGTVGITSGFDDGRLESVTLDNGGDGGKLAALAGLAICSRICVSAAVTRAYGRRLRLEVSAQHQTATLACTTYGATNAHLILAHIPPLPQFFGPDCSSPSHCVVSNLTTRPPPLTLPLEADREFRAVQVHARLAASLSTSHRSIARLN